MGTPSNFRDLTGQKFGRLKVLFRDKNRNGNAYWNCKCDCGNKVVKSTDYLKRSNLCSCGCASNRTKNPKDKLDNPILENKVYSRTRIYRIWQAMKTRCYNPNHRHYCDYGGRGITICEEWLNSSVSFINWSYNNGYNDKLSIERKDTNGNYCPENCIWVDSKTQSNNKRTSHFVTFNGKTQTIAQWAEELGIPYNTLQKRLTEGKWSVERALTTIPEKKK